jgi:hypothetical protein
MLLAAERMFNLEPARRFHEHPGSTGAHAVLDEHDEALAAILGAVYEATQAWLKRQGRRDRVLLWRGLSVSYGHAMVNRALHHCDPKLWPLSSWTSDFATAMEFAPSTERSRTNPGGKLLLADVPIERVVSTAATGFGCPSQDEFVVLGGPADVWAMSWPSRFDRRLPAVTEFDYLRRIGEHDEAPPHRQEGGSRCY